MAVSQANKEALLNLVVCLNGAAFKKEVPKQFGELSLPGVGFSHLMI